MKVVSAAALGAARRKAIFNGSLAVTATLASGILLVLPAPAANAQVIVGTDRGDHIIGTAQYDRIRARGGDDFVAARVGEDHVKGAPGSDTIRGGPGRDYWLDGGKGRDTIFGGPGSDRTLSDGFGNDEMRGGGGNDFIQAGPGADSAYGGFGKDEITLNQTRHNGRDSVHGGPGNDSIDVENDGLPDLIDCGAGRDRVWYNAFHGPPEELDQLINCEAVGEF